MDCTISSTGFINYFPSAERTQRAIDAAYAKYGSEIAIIDGDDDWNASNCFHISYLLNKFKIQKLGSFHTGISGITTSGAVIAKKDLPTFIKKFNKYKWSIYRESSHKGWSTDAISIYNAENKVWMKFFELQFKENEITDLYKRKTKRIEVHNTINNFKIKKNTYMFPK